MILNASLCLSAFVVREWYLISKLYLAICLSLDLVQSARSLPDHSLIGVNTLMKS